MKILENKYYPLGIAIISFITAGAVYQLLPENIATHWGIDGQVNDYMTKFWGLAFMPLMSLFMLGLFYVIPRIDPKKENIKQFDLYFRRFIGVLFSFLYYLFLLTIAWNLGYRFDMIQLMAPALALLMFTVGLLVEKTKPNWTIGIRTPWTLSSPVVWEKTHKLGGKLIKIGSGIALAGVILPQFAFWLILIPMISWSVFLIGYSYVEYSKEKKISP